MSSETMKQIEFLARALKAPRIRDSAGRLADQAREAGWSHEDYLAAVLDREVSARDASGGRIRIRSAGFPSRKTLEDFVFDHQPALKRDQILHLAGGSFLEHARNVVLLGPPGTGNTSRDRSRCQSGRDWPSGAVRDRDRLGRPAANRSPAGSPAARTGPSAPLRTDHRRRSRIHPVRARRREPVFPTGVIPLRTCVTDPDQQPPVRALGRCLRRPGRGRRDDRPHRPPRRRDQPARPQLPPQRHRDHYTAFRQAREHRRINTPRWSTFPRAKPDYFSTSVDSSGSADDPAGESF
jgi:hypothetical protein